MPSWKHGCFLAEYLVWFIHDYSADVNISLSPSRLLFFCVLRHIQPAVQLLLVAQLAQRLAEQLDCETGNCQFPVFEASVPLSDSQLQKLLCQRSQLKSWCFTLESCSECKVFNASTNV